jgi:hypothetical protein
MTWRATRRAAAGLGQDRQSTIRRPRLPPEAVPPCRPACRTWKHCRLPIRSSRRAGIRSPATSRPLRRQYGSGNPGSGPAVLLGTAFLASRTPGSARSGSGSDSSRRPRRTAAVCAFSLGSLVAQRDGGTGARRGGQQHPPVPSARDRTGRPTAMFPGPGRLPEPGYPGARPSSIGPIRASRPGSRSPSAVALDHLRRQGRRSPGRDASAIRQSTKTLSAAPMRAIGVKRAYGSSPVATCFRPGLG